MFKRGGGTKYLYIVNDSSHQYGAYWASGTLHVLTHFILTTALSLSPLYR